MLVLDTSITNSQSKTAPSTTTVNVSSGLSISQGLAHVTVVESLR